MANVIKHKRGSGSDPGASDLILGELAIRTDTGKLFTKMDSGAIAEIAGGGSDIAINTLSSSSGTGGGSATFNGSAYRFTLSAPPNVSAAQLLVSINGVIQKPVAGTGQPSEGFSVDGTDIILGDAPATGSDFFILTFKSLGVSEPADNSVTSAKIVDGAIVNADINASAAIAGTKIDPNFGTQTVTSSYLTLSAVNPNISFTDTNDNPDFKLEANSGQFKIIDTSGSGSDRLIVQNDGTIDVEGNLDANGGLDVTGAITGTGDLTIDTNTLHVDSTNNRVGIGTVNPTTPFHVFHATTNGVATFESGDTDAVITLKDNAGQASVRAIGNALTLNTSSSNSERLRIDSSGRLLIGISTARANFGNNTSGVEQRIQLEGTSSITSSMSLIRNSNDANDGGIIVGKTRGTSTGSNTVVQAGDDLGNISFVGADGTSMQFGADIKATVESGVGNDDMPAALVFSTNGGTTSTTERMRIDSSGRLLVGGTDASVVHTNADDVVIGNTSASVAGLSIATSTSGYATLQFSDGAGNKNQGQIAYNHADNSLALTTDSSVRMTIDSSGKVGIGTSSPATPLHIKPASNMSQLLLEQNNATDGYALFQDGPNGGHLKFMRRISGSDTQTLLLRSDGGLCFGTDSAAANALDDYEEGTFTPVLKGTSGGGTLTSSSAAGSGGNYTKVGNKVHLSFYFANPTGSNPSGTLYFELPFSVASGNDYNGSGGCVTYTRNIFPETDRMFAVNAIAGTNKLYIARVSVGGQGETGYQTINNDSDLTSMLFKATVSYAAA
jgi:hypothetical protein